MPSPTDSILGIFYPCFISTFIHIDDIGCSLAYSRVEICTSQAMESFPSPQIYLTQLR